MGWTAATVRRNAALRSKLGEQRGKNGKRERVYAASSLPAEFQAKLLEYCIRKHSMQHALPAHVPETGTGLAPCGSAVGVQRSLFPALLAMPSAELADLNDEQKETARQRFQVVSSLLEWRDGSVPPFRTEDGREIRTLDHFVMYHAQLLNVRGRTIYKWLARYDKGGITPLQKFKALADHARTDRGVPRSLAKYPKVAEYALIKYLGLAPSAYLQAARELRLPVPSDKEFRMPNYQSERLPITAVYEGIEREWPKWYPSSTVGAAFRGPKPPSYTTIRNFLQSIPNCVKVMAREGITAYENKCEPHGKRRRDDIAPNALWVSDHRILDVFAWNDYFPSILQEQGSWMRLWVTHIEDERTRRIVGWAFSVNPSSRSVAAALRMAATRFGMPAEFYFDNGADYDLFAKILFESFAIRRRSAIPFRPRSKSVESFHSHQSKRFDPIWGPAYAGHDAKDRSEENTLALRQHKLWRDGKAAATPLPPVSYLMEQFAAWIEAEYNERPHSGQDMQGLSPRVMYDREMPLEKLQPLDVAQMEPLFWQRETRDVRNAKVRIFSQDYEAADQESDHNLRLLPEGAKVRVACNPDDIAVALCYEAEGPDHRFIARLRAPHLLSFNPISRDEIASRERQNAHFRKNLKQGLRVLGTRAVAAGITSELDSLAARAGVAMPITACAASCVPQSIALPAHVSLQPVQAVPSAANTAAYLMEED